MNTRSSDEKIKIEIAQTESTPREKKKPREDSHRAERKPLEKMTKAELLQRVKELQDKSEKNYDLYLRSQAEIDNIIKRNKKEKEEWVKYSNETLIKEILPVMDNLEKAVSHSRDENSFDALREGVELTLRGLRDTLVKSGLKEVKTEDEPFDPCFHHAVSEQNDENVEAGIIINELQKGYTLNQRLIRPAMVVLSKGKTDTKENHEKGPHIVCEE